MEVGIQVIRVVQAVQAVKKGPNSLGCRICHPSSLISLISLFNSPFDLGQSLFTPDLLVEFFVLSQAACSFDRRNCIPSAATISPKPIILAI